MIVSETPKRVTSRWLRVCVLLCAVVVLPLGTAYAQDYEAVGKRLKGAVEAGELTAEQARAMLGALRKAGGDGQDQAADKARAYLMKVKKELGAAVEAGKISNKDAAKRFEAAEKAVRERLAAGRGQSCEKEAPAPDRARAHLMKIRKELGAAVEAGKISKEDAAKKFEGAAKEIRQRMAAGEYLMKVRKELGAAVEAGKISKEDAAKKFEAAEKAIREKMAAGRGECDSKRISKEDLDRAGRAIREAVAAGKLAAEEGRAKMQAMRKMVERQGQPRSDARPDWENIKRRIEGAVERGDMTREQADAKYREIKERMAGERRRSDERSGEGVEEWIKSIGERLKEAVEAGKLSEEEAWAKWQAIKEKEIGPKLKASVKAGVMSEEKAWGIWRGIEKAETAERLKAAVKKGELTEEEARAKWAEIDKEGDEDDEGDGEGGLEAVGEYLRGIGERIRGAVAEGELSEEDGWAKWYEVKEKVIKGAVKSGKISREEAGVLWREIEKGEAAAKLKMAVEKGELTEEEARAKWAEIDEEDEEEEDGEESDDEEEDDEHAGIQPVPVEAARAIGKALLEAAPLNFAGDPSQAVGVFAKDDEKILGMILVPTGGLNEDDAEMEIGETEPLALLFCSPSILPATDGSTLIERDKLHSVTITDGEGNEHDSNCMMLVVKRIAEEDYRLYGIGKNANEPLIDGGFDDGEGPGQTPLAVEVKDIDEESETAAVVITVFNKYQAAFRAGVLE